jgi:hypothetical protein
MAHRASYTQLNDAPGCDGGSNGAEAAISPAELVYDAVYDRVAATCGHMCATVTFAVAAISICPLAFVALGIVLLLLCLLVGWLSGGERGITLRR